MATERGVRMAELFPLNDTELLFFADPVWAGRCGGVEPAHGGVVTGIELGDFQHRGHGVRLRRVRVDVADEMRFDLGE